MHYLCRQSAIRWSKRIKIGEVLIFSALEKCPLSFTGENLNLVNRLPPPVEIKTFEECKLFCEDIPPCNGITWIPICLENQGRRNCYFSVDTSGPGGLPVTETVPVPEQTGCEWASYVRDCKLLFKNKIYAY